MNHRLPGCSFVGNTLYGTDAQGFSFISVNHLTALVTVIGPNMFAASAGGFASDATNSNVYYLTFDGAPIFSVNVTTGVFTPGATLSGATGLRFNSAAFHNGTLYAIASDAAPGMVRQLVIVNPTSGAVTPVGTNQPSGAIDAIASSTR